MTDEAAVLVAPAPVTVRRFGLPDLADQGRWLVERLRARYLHLQDKQIMGWMRGLIDSPESFFVCTRNAVAMAQIEHPTLSPVPTVVERFVLCRDPKNEDCLAEAAMLYDEIKGWANRLGAAEIRVLELSDVPEPVVKERMGRVLRRSHWIVPLGR